MTQNEGPSKPIYEVWRNVLVWVFNGVAKCSMDQPQRCRTGLGPNSPSRHQQHEVEGCSMRPISGDKPSRWRLARTRSCVLLTWRKDAHSCALLTWRKDAHWLFLSVHRHLTNVHSPCHCLYAWSHIRLSWPSGGSCLCFFNFALLQLLEARRTARPHSGGWLLLRAPLSASPTPASAFNGWRSVWDDCNVNILLWRSNVCALWCSWRRDHLCRRHVLHCYSLCWVCCLGRGIVIRGAARGV